MFNRASGFFGNTPNAGDSQPDAEIFYLAKRNAKVAASIKLHSVPNTYISTGKSSNFMTKIFITCMLFSLIKGECSAQKYIHISFVTYNQDHLFPNLIILYNKNDYKLNRADTLSFLQVFEVKKTDFKSVAAFVSNTLLKIKKEPTDKTEKIEECYFIEIMYDASKSDDFFLPRNACRKFFSEYEEIIKSAKMGRKLSIAIKLCGIECK